MERSTHKRSLFILLLAFVMVFTVACSDTTNETSQTEAPVTTTAAQATDAPEVTEEPSYFNATGYPICDDPITLTVSGPIGSTPDWNDTIMVEQIAERLGIILDCSPITDDAWETQLTLMLSSDALPDLILLSGLSASEVADYGSQGFFLVLNDLIEAYAPNLRSYMDKYDMLDNYMTSSDGNMYMTVKVTENPFSLAPRVFMNKNWLENVSMEAPSTLDELYAVLTAFKEQDANGNGDPDDEIPMGNLSIYMNPALLTAFGIYTRSSKLLLQVDDSGTVYAAETTDNYKAYLTFLKKLYEEGLLDSEVFIETGDELKAKIAEDRVGFYSHYAPFVAAGTDISYDENFIWSGAYTSEWNDTPTIVYSQMIGSSPIVNVIAKTQYPEAIIRLIDYFHTEEGIMGAMRGYEGYSFDWVDANYGDIMTIRNTNILPYAGEYDSAESFRYMKATINNGFLMIAPTAPNYQLLLDIDYDELLHEGLDITDSSGELIDHWYVDWGRITAYYAIRNPEVETVMTFPTLIYTDEENDARSTLYTDITTYLESAKTQFITGEVGIDEGWDSYLSTLEQMGLSDLVAIDQGAYSRLMGN